MAQAVKAVSLESQFRHESDKGIVQQLQSLKLVSGTGAAAGVLATVNMSDASNPTLQVDARLEGEHGNAYTVNAIRYDDANGKKVFDLYLYDDGDLVNPLEKWEALSMVDADPRYVETIVNDADTGSDRIRVTDLDSATAGDEADVARPVTDSPGDNDLTSGAGEFTVTGVSRNTVILGVINLTDNDLPPIAEVNAVDTDKCAMAVGATTTATDTLVMLVLDPAAL